MMEQRKKSFFILLLVLAVFTVGAAIFSNNKDMVYEETEETEEESVVSDAIVENDFFSDFRVGRDRRRDAEKELYESILRDSSRSEEAKSEAEASLTRLYRISSLEDRVEEILIGRNYEDALFVVEDTISLLILRERDLGEEEKASLVNFVATYAGIPGESISVFTID